MAGKQEVKKPKMSPEEVSEMKRRAVMARWARHDPNRNKPTPEAIELVKHACAIGATIGKIIEVLDISEHKFHKFMRESPDFAAAVKAGRQIEHDALVNKLVECALKGNVTALCFALKTRHNYVDTGTGAAAVVENKVSVNFILPDALKPEQYLSALTATSEIVKPEAVTRALAKPGVKVKVLRQLSAERAGEAGGNTNG